MLFWTVLLKMILSLILLLFCMTLAVQGNEGLAEQNSSQTNGNASCKNLKWNEFEATIESLVTPVDSGLYLIFCWLQYWYHLFYNRKNASCLLRFFQKVFTFLSFFSWLLFWASLFILSVGCRLTNIIPYTIFIPMPEWGAWLLAAILYLLMWFEFWISEDRQYLSNIHKKKPMEKYIVAVKNVQPKIKWKAATFEWNTEKNNIFKQVHVSMLQAIVEKSGFRGNSSSGILPLSKTPFSYLSSVSALHYLQFWIKI